MEDFILKDFKNQHNDDKYIHLSGNFDEYSVFIKDDVVILKDNVKDRDGVIFLTKQDEKIRFKNQCLKCDEIIKKINTNNDINDTKPMIDDSVLFGCINSNIAFTKDFNAKAAKSSKEIGEFLGNNYILKKTIYADCNTQKIYFLQDFMKISDKIDLKITLKDYEQSKDSIGFDGKMNTDFEYKYSVLDEQLCVFIKINQNSLNVLSKFYYISSSGFEQKIFDICVNDDILYEIKILG